MPRDSLAPGEYYHIFNRGVLKQDIFLDRRDYERMLFLLFCFQSPVPIRHISDDLEDFTVHGISSIPNAVREEILKERTVELISFVLMPNHFHLIVRELEEGGISKYLQRIGNAYTKYFNIKYERSGYLFQGPFQSIRVKDNAQALYLSAYVHLNPRELPRWKDKEQEYPWSSYQDFIVKNRWGVFLKPAIIITQFASPREYTRYVKTSGAKKTGLGDEKDFLLES